AFEEAGELKASLEYSTDLFQKATAARMLGHFRNLLESIAADPGQALSELHLLAEAERQQLLVAFNDTAAPYPSDQCVHHFIEEQAERTPEALALTFGVKGLSYGELNGRANRLARHLREMGAEPEAVVGVCMQRSTEMVVALLAILKSGAAYLPLDPEYPRDRLAYMIEDAGIKVLAADQR